MTRARRGHLGEVIDERTTAAQRATDAAAAAHTALRQEPRMQGQFGTADSLSECAVTRVASNMIRKPGQIRPPARCPPNGPTVSARCAHNCYRARARAARIRFSAAESILSRTRHAVAGEATDRTASADPATPPGH